MATIRLLKYNNYYNRIVKREDSINEYATHVCVDEQGNEAYWVGRTNFIMRDGVDTTYVANWHGTTPDYLLVTDDTDRTILSRWFVIEANYSAVGQYVLTLHRDLIVDYYNDVVNAKTYIEKATLNMNDPFIFNSENIEFNQIKTNEHLIQDDASPKDLAWLVGYCAANAELGKITIPNYGEVDIIGSDNIPYKQFLNNDKLIIEEEEAYSIKLNLRLVTADPITGGGYFNLGVELRVYTNNNIVVYGFGDPYTNDYINLHLDSKKYHVITNKWNDLTKAQQKAYVQNIIDEYLNGSQFDKNKNAVWNEINNTYKVITEKEYQTILDQDGKIVQDTNVLKKLVVKQKYNIITGGDIFTTVPNGSSTYIEVKNEIYKIPHEDNISIVGDNSVRLILSIPRYYYSYKKVSTTIGISSSVDMTNRGHLSDQPFDIFAIPYPTKSETIPVYDSVNSKEFIIKKDVAFDTAMEIIRTQGAKIFDIQLLPYCPMREIFSKSPSTGEPIIDIGKYSDRISLITDEAAYTVGMIIYPNLSKEKFSISYNGYKKASSAIEKKVKTLTKKHRLCSPGYNSIFEFNAEKNNGIAYFNVFCNFKPISPYIHIAPNFGGLYGANYEDMRGLTCEEDFSITKVEDAFVDFELRNKNYQNIFNREIQNLEDTHELRQMKGIYDTIIGSVGAGIIAGTSKMGGFGAGIGAAGQTAIGGIVNLGFSEAAHGLELDYKKDRFGYNLDNIRALPQSIGKITAFCINNKIFPVLEEYSATPEEEQALRDKLEYNGMSVHRIGSIAEFLTSKKQFIQGEVIRMENLVEDYHLSYSIALEIRSGVYI